MITGRTPYVMLWFDVGLKRYTTAELYYSTHYRCGLM